MSVPYNKAGIEGVAIFNNETLFTGMFCVTIPTENFLASILSTETETYNPLRRQFMCI